MPELGKFEIDALNFPTAEAKELAKNSVVRLSASPVPGYRKVGF